MWEVRETFVAVITTSLPPIAPLIRKWMNCLGAQENLSTAERVEAAKRRGSESSQCTKRSASNASVKAQAKRKHNTAMAERYLSDFDSQEKAPIYDSGSDLTRSNSMGSTASTSTTVTQRTAEEIMTDAVARDPHAPTTPGQNSVFSTDSRRDDDADADAVPQTVREIV